MTRRYDPRDYEALGMEPDDDVEQFREGLLASDMREAFLAMLDTYCDQ
jgi:hypothetical protein